MNDDRITRVYKYGLLAPIEGAEVAYEQLRLAHRYYNTLIEIERVRRDRERSLDDGEARAVLEAAEDKSESAAKALKSWRANERRRGRYDETKALTEALKAARKQVRDARAVLRERREQLRAGIDYAAKLKEINEDANERRKAARKASGLYPGTYQLVELAVDQASKYRTTPLWDGARPNNPRFQRWDRSGRLGVQIPWPIDEPPPCTTETVLAQSDTRVQLDCDPAIDTRPDSNMKRNRPRVRLWLRVASTRERSPVWAVFPMTLHRPLPPGAAVKRVVVNAKRRGPKLHWSVDFTLQIPSTYFASTCGVGTVAFDFGFRKFEDRLRVARYADPDGTGEYSAPLDGRLITGIEKADSLRRIRDRGRDELLAKLEPMLRTLELPEWFLRRTVKRNAALPTVVQACAYLSWWRSNEKLGALVRYWRDNRFEGDAEAYELAEAWRYHDYHLWGWEVNQRRKTIARRRDDYRVFANDIAKRYDTLVLADVDFSKVAKRPEPDGDPHIAAAAHNRVVVAPSEMRGALINAFQRRRGRVVVLLHGGDAKARKLKTLAAQGIEAVTYDGDKTHDCHECGHRVEFDRVQWVWARCSNCGTAWDQDDNAAQNLLRTFTALGGAAGSSSTKVSTSVRETRFQRAARERKEREAASEASGS